MFLGGGRHCRRRPGIFCSVLLLLHLVSSAFVLLCDVTFDVASLSPFTPLEDSDPFLFGFFSRVRVFIHTPYSALSRCCFPDASEFQSLQSYNTAFVGSRSGFEKLFISVEKSRSHLSSSLLMWSSSMTHLQPEASILISQKVAGLTQLKKLLYLSSNRLVTKPPIVLQCRVVHLAVHTGDSNHRRCFSRRDSSPIAMELHDSLFRTMCGCGEYINPNAASKFQMGFYGPNLLFSCWVWVRCINPFVRSKVSMGIYGPYLSISCWVWVMDLLLDGNIYEVLSLVWLFPLVHWVIMAQDYGITLTSLPNIHPSVKESPTLLFLVVRVVYHLDSQSWYVVDPRGHLVCFGTDPNIKIVESVLNMLSSLIRSIGILIGALHSSLPFSHGWSFQRGLFRSVLESHAGYRSSFMRNLVVMVGSLIRSIGILVGIHSDLSPLFVSWDLWLDLKLGGFEPKVVLLSSVHQFCARDFLAVIKLASLLDVISPIRESTTWSGLVHRTLHPVRVVPVQRLHPLLEEFQTALTRDLIEFSAAVIFWSTSEKCEKPCFEHLDPIEDNLGEYHRQTMSFGNLSFYVSCTFVVCFIFFMILVWFEDAMKMDVMTM